MELDGPFQKCWKRIDLMNVKDYKIFSNSMMDEGKVQKFLLQLRFIRFDI